VGRPHPDGAARPVPSGALRAICAHFQARLRLLQYPGRATDRVVESAFPREPISGTPELSAIVRFGRTLPLPMRFLPRSSEALWSLGYQALGVMDMELDKAWEGGCARIPMLPEDLRDMAGKIRSAFPGEDEFAERLLAIADQKEKLLHGGVLAAREAPGHLPGLAFPVILDGKGPPTVVWEAVFTGNLAGVFRPSRSRAGSSFAEGIERAGGLIRNRFGDSVDTRLLCPATHLFGLKTDGFSGSLAMWAALWLAAMGVRVPGGALAVTGKLSDTGRVESVAHTEVKAKIALSCGFPYVVVPSEDLEEGPDWMRRDGRIVGIRDCDQFHEWLLLADPEYSIRGKLFHIARGVRSPKLLPAEESIRPVIAADLEAGTWADTWQNLRRVARESPRSGGEKRWRAVVGTCRKALAGLLRENQSARIPRQRWFGLFRAIVPESVFLLHLPLLLERYGRHERALADQLYARLGHRLADQDLQLDLALKWGSGLFLSPEVSPWARDREFRERYPLLCWLLFSDPFVALEAMSGWQPLTSLEEQWRRRIFRGLQQLEPGELANPENENQRGVRRILAFAARSGSPAGDGRLCENSLGVWEFRPAVANVTPIDHRPKRMLQILLLSERLTRAERQTLSRHFRAHVECRRPTPDDRLLVEDLLRCRPTDEDERWRLARRCGSSALQMLKNCEAVLKPRGKQRGRRSHNWIELLRDAWRVEGEPEVAENERRERIRSLDNALTRALGNLFDGTIGDVKEQAFQCLVNPALVLARLSLSFEAAGRVSDGIGAHLDRWYAFIVEKPLPGLGYRSDLVRECLLHWAGRLTGEGHLPEPRWSRRRSLGLSFWSGFHGVGGKTGKPVSGEEWLKWILCAVRNGEPSVIWLPVMEAILSQQEWSLLETELDRHRATLVARTDGTDLEMNLLGLRLCRAAWPKRAIWKSFPSEWFLSANEWVRGMHDKAHRVRTTEEGLAPLGIGWLRGEVPWGLGRRLAGSRGFTPVAPACQELFSPRGRRSFGALLRLLGVPGLWQVEWERNIFISIYILQCRHAGRSSLVGKTMAWDGCDPANTFLGADLSEGTSLPR